MTIGNKETFAIELEFVNLEKTKGHSRIWINSYEIGDFKSIEILAPLMNPLCASLETPPPQLNLGLLNSKQDLLNILSNYDKYNLFFNELITSKKTIPESFDSHAAFPAENFDHLFIAEFIYQNSRYFLWIDISLLKSNPLENQIHLEKVNEFEYREIIQMIKKFWNTER